jgi:hypothetical protein
LSNSSRLPLVSGPSTLTPVTLPPGLARLATNPIPTGLVLVMTMGMVVVFCRAARGGSHGAELEGGILSTFTDQEVVSRVRSGPCVIQQQCPSSSWGLSQRFFSVCLL